MNNALLSLLLWLTVLVQAVDSSSRKNDICLLMVVPRGGARHDHNDNDNSIFASLVRQSSRALAATARGSTKVAADLIRPKDVAWDELVGFWKIDLSFDDRGGVPPLTIHLTRDGRAQWTTNNGDENDYKVEFRPAAWPRFARLKFGSPKFYYQCTVQRKLANLDILKLRGKVYAVRRFQGKHQVGTFVGRRVVVVTDDSGDEQEGYDSDVEDDNEEEEEDKNVEAEIEGDRGREDHTLHIVSEDEPNEDIDADVLEDYSEWEED